MINPVPWGGVIVVLAIPMVYIAFLRALANRTYHARIELRALGLRLRADDRCNESTKRFIDLALGNFHSYRGAVWWLAGSVIILFRALRSLFIERKPVASLHPGVAPNLGRFVRLYLRSIFAANPIVGCAAHIIMNIAFAIYEVARPMSRAAKQVELAQFAAAHAA